MFMNRLIHRISSVLVLLFMFSHAHAQQGYEVLAAPQRTANPEKIEVMEFFWYGCPHCYQLEPHMKEWLADKPDNVEFVLVAPPLGPNWKVHSQAFYAAQVLGILDQFHEAMFNARHRDNKQLRKPKEIGQLVDSLELEVDGKKFVKTMKSFNVDAKLRQAMQLARDMKITSVPSVIVNGKYKTSGRLAGDYPTMMSVISKLVEQETVAE